MLCPNCGAKGIDAAKFCAECGADFRRAGESASQPTTSIVGDEASSALDALVRGRTYVLYAVLGSFLALLLMYSVKLGVPSWPFILAWWVCYIHAVVDCYAMAKGLGISGWSRFGIVVLAIVPFVNFIVVAALCIVATKRIRKAGYSFGPFGVRGYKYRT